MSIFSRTFPTPRPASRRRGAAAIATGAVLVTTTAWAPIAQSAAAIPTISEVRSSAASASGATASPGFSPGATVAGVTTRQAAPSSARPLVATAVKASTVPSRPAPAPAPAPAAPSTLVFGGVGNVASMSSAAGKNMATHDYGHFQSSRVAAGSMITVNAQGVPWATVAAAKPGTTLYNDIVRWARTIKARPGTFEVAFGHEPEQANKRALGTPAQYQAAYRRVVTIFREQKVTNVRWVFQTTSWGYLAASTAANYAPKYYPGDAYVDVIGPDGYNWHTCGQGNGVSRSMAEIFKGALAFAKAHKKKMSIPEFGANVTVSRDKWLRDGFTWMKANKSVMSSAYYFNRPTTNTNNTDCKWPLSRATEYQAVAAIAADPWTTP